MNKIKSLFKFNVNIINSFNKFLQKKNIIAFLLNFILNFSYLFRKKIKSIKIKNSDDEGIKFDLNLKIDNNSLKILESNIKKIKKIHFESKNKPLVSIIIPCFNNFDYTIKCLKSIMLSKTKICFEIIIADDHSNKQTLKKYEYFEGVKVIKNELDNGYINNCNFAARKSKGEFLLFLNNDTIIFDYFLDYLVDVMYAKKDAGVVGAKVLMPNLKTQEFAPLIFKNGIDNFSYRDNNDLTVNYLKECDYVSGCSLLTRKVLFDKLKGFDTRYNPAYCDDSDYCIALFNNFGYKTYCQPKSIIIHYGSKSYKKSSIKLQKRNNELLNKKWADYFDNKIRMKEWKDCSFLKRKATILVVDDNLPEYDKHAGGKTIYQYLNVFKKMNLCVKFCPLMSSVIFDPYFSLLTENEIEIINPNFLDFYIKTHSGEIDYLFLSRLHVVQRLMLSTYRSNKIKVLYYGHDLNFLRMQRENKFNKLFKEADIENVKYLEKEIITFCDTAFFPSKFEKDILYNDLKLKNVDVVTPYAYNIDDMPKHLDFKQSDGLLFIGSKGHRPNVDGILWFINDVFPLIINKNSKIKLYIIGGVCEAIKGKFKLNNNVILLGIKSQIELDKVYKKIKFSIAPLRFGAGIKGKIIESIYHRVPVITTTIGAEGIEDKYDLIKTCNSEIEMANTIVDYYDNYDYLNKCIVFSQNFIEENYSISSAIKSFSKYIDSSPRDN